MKFEILPLDRGLVSLFPRENEPFAVIGRLVPSYGEGRWSWEEVLFDRPGEKTYPEEPFEAEDYVDSPERAMFLALADGACLGHIRLRKSWNGYGLVEDIAVRRAFRGRGVGTALLDAALAWAKEAGLSGVMLETQDNNLLACRFYLKYGFALGGLDTRVYTQTRFSEETALYFYYLFSERE